MGNVYLKLNVCVPDVSAIFATVRISAKVTEEWEVGLMRAHSAREFVHQSVMVGFVVWGLIQGRRTNGFGGM